MFSRKLNSEISYPFIPEVPDRKYIGGIMDVRLTVVGNSTGTSTYPAYKPYYAFLKGIMINPGSTRFTFHAVSESAGKYWEFNFNVPWGMGVGSVKTASLDGSLGVMIVNSLFIYKDSNLVLAGPNYELEPGAQMWFENKVKTLNFANEYRNFDPTQRGNLSNDYLCRFSNSETVKLGSGYNVSLSYNSPSITVDGNVGNGKGVAPDNMWDVGPSWDNSQDGLLMVNGIVPDTNGDIPMDKSVSINLIASKGKLEVNIV